MNTYQLKDCQKETIKEICATFDNNPSELINVLHTTQGKFGYLPDAVQCEVANNLGISAAQVYGVITFYSFFTMTPKGKHTISLCTGTACYVRGAEKILDELKDILKIKVGEVTPDGLFSLDCLRCVGACGLAPVMLIDDKVYGGVEAANLREILKEYK